MEATANHETVGQWIDRSRRGDRDAFACLVRQYQGMVSGVALSRTGDVHQSEDLAQETFLLAWQKLAELDDVEKFPGWICSIARNLARNAVRKKSETERTGTPLEAESTSTNPMESLIAAEQNALVGAALQKIPENYRESLILFYRGEQSTKQIADALDITEEAARQRLSRARKFLRKELERQVADVISSSGPGEFFSLAVIAALPVAGMFTSTGQAAAATIIGTGTPLAVGSTAPIAVCVTPKSGGGTASLFGMTSFGNWFYSVASFLLTVLGFFFWILGATPGIWLSVRNAPTLRARRYLILTSMRLHVVFAGFMAFACLFPACWMLFRAFPQGKHYPLPDTVFTFGYLAGLGMIGAAALFLLIRSPLVYRRIVEEDTGLRVPKKAVPLEESFLSFQRLERSFFRSGTAMIVFFLIAASDFIVWREMGRSRYTAYMLGTAWYDWLIFHLQHYVLFVVVGLVFLFVFWRLHRMFLAMAKDDAAFAATPPRKFSESAKQPEPSFSERIFAEWLVSFGLFVAAVLIFSQAVFPLEITYLPVSHFAHLTLLVGGSAILAVLNTRFPAFRWFIGFGVFAVLVFCSVYCLTATFNGWWGHYPFQDFFESPRAWPVVFGIMLLDRIILFGTVVALIGGAFWLRNRWIGRTNRWLSRKSFAVVLTVGIFSILGVSLVNYSETRLRYHEQLLIFIDNWRSESGPEKKIVLATEVLRLTKDKPELGVNALQIRAMQYLQLGKFNEAIADFDELYNIYNVPAYKDRNQEFLANYRAYRGAARLAVGDCRLAIADCTWAIEHPNRLWVGRNLVDVYYNRGYAHEKLGETAAAIADYDEAIRVLEQQPHREWKRIYSVAVRPEFDDEARRSTQPYRPGFRISQDELKKIRDGLAPLESEPRP